MMQQTDCSFNLLYFALGGLYRQQGFQPVYGLLQPLQQMRHR